MQVGLLCSHPSHWLDSVLLGTGLREPPPIEDLEDVSFFKRLGPAAPADNTPNEPTTCELHEVETYTEIVPIHYGTPISMFRKPDGTRYLAPEEIDPDIRQKEFPLAAHWRWGGCCATDILCARVRICPECERAEKRWREEHPDTKSP